MKQDNVPDIRAQISEILNKNNKKYLTITQIKNLLCVKSLKYFKLTKSQSRPIDVLKALTPHLGDDLKVYKGPRSSYIGFNMTLEKIILDKITQNPGLSSKNLGKNLPMLKKDYIKALNELLSNGKIYCTFNESHNTKLQLCKIDKTKPDLALTKNFYSEFKAAYNHIGNGRAFVRIHKIREYLGWPDSQFEKILKELMAKYIIELHAGDPSTLTKNQLINSFKDENGNLYITLTWWGEQNEKS